MIGSEYKINQRIEYIGQHNCLELMDKMIKNNIKVDLIYTDPPYNISNKRVFKRKNTKDVSMNFGEWDHFDTWENYYNWMITWLEKFKYILKDNGQLLCYSPHDEIEPIMAIKKYFNIKKSIYWHKTNPTPQFMKISYLSSVERIIWAINCLDNSYTFNFKEQKNMHNFIATYDENNINCCIQTPICMGKERKDGGHPTQKRIDITKHFIEIHTNENDIIFDPFCGVGTTAIASKLLNRQFICCDINEKYIENAKKRLKNIA